MAEARSNGTRAVRICLLWHGVDSGNLGVRALTESQIALVRQAAASLGVEVRFEIVGWAGSADPGRFRGLGVDRITPVNGRSLLLPSGVAAAFGRSDLVLDIGEGDSFSDIYGPKRLAYFSVTKLLASRGGRPLVLSPQTMGPFTRWWSILLSDLCLRRAKHLFPRDTLSMAYIRSRKLDVPADEIVDVAFALPFDPAPARAGGRVRVGINVSGLLWAEAAGSNRFGLTLDYRDFVTKLCHHFTSQQEVDLIFVPHVLGDEGSVDSDSAVSAALCEQFPSARLAPRFEGPSEAKSFIAGLDFFSGARMHACIAAVSSGVPVVPQAYSRKFTGLFNTIGYPHVADCQRLTRDAAFDQVVQAYLSRAVLAQEARRGNAVAQGRLELYVAKLAELIGRARSAKSD